MLEVPLRIAVVDPPQGVAWAVQNGRTDLIEASQRSATLIAFDLSVRLGAPRAGGQPNFLGPVTQGPAAARFVYVNSGRRAGQAESCWDRRAKVPLVGITHQLLDQLRRKPGARLEARLAGTGPDGGPSCATVPLLGGGWRIVVAASA